VAVRTCDGESLNIFGAELKGYDFRASDIRRRDFSYQRLRELGFSVTADQPIATSSSAFAAHPG
jgi:hypothetical protein